VVAPHVELLYLDGCPNWEVVAVRLSVALQATGLADVHVHLRRIDSFEEAEQAAFTGSPMIRIDGVDPFSGPDQPVAFACRVFYDGEDIVSGPTVVQLLDALVSARSRTRHR
jgi:hypothetical protein